MDKFSWKIVFFCLALIGVGFCNETNRDSRVCKTIRTRILSEGDTFEPRKCFICICRNSSLDCDQMEPEDCPPLPCEAAVQMSTADRCCKICPGTLARCRFNGMTVEDGECFQLHPRGSCQCHAGRLTCVKDSPSADQMAAPTA